jgi:transcription elongation factor GreB
MLMSHWRIRTNRWVWLFGSGLLGLIGLTRKRVVCLHCPVMGRYRPPAAPSSPYITADGYAALQQDLQLQWKKRPEVTKALTAAAAEGDRSENAEYHYRKKELAGIDRRIHYLQKRLPVLKVVATQPDSPGRVFFGAWVQLEDDDGTQYRYRIVGPDEFDAERHWISMDAPVAKALMGKSIDDEVQIHTPGGQIRCIIVAVDYS